MWARIELENWRSIEHARVALAPLTILVGKNASGKSNLCDALMFFREIATDASTAVSRRGGIESIRRWSPSKPYTVSLELLVAPSEERSDTNFVRHRVRLATGRDGDWSFEAEQIEIRTPEHELVVDRAGDELSFSQKSSPIARAQIAATTSAMLFVRQWALSAPQRRTLEMMLATRTVRPSPELMRQPQTATEHARIEAAGQTITSALQQLTPKQSSEVLASMQQIVPGLTKIEVQSTGRYRTVLFSQVKAEGRVAQFTATEMSDGALRALAIIVAAEQNADGELLIVEEPEVNLHPGASGVVFDALRTASKRGAVLLTTHSPELLDRAADESILVCEYVDGLTEVGALAPKQREAVRSGLFSVSELLRSDALRREGATVSLVQ